MPVQFLGMSKPREALGFFTTGYVGYFPNGVPLGVGPVIDFSDDTNSMYVVIISAFV